MKYRGLFEYEYPTEHKPPVSIDVHLHGDCVKGKIIEWEYRPLEQEPCKQEPCKVSEYDKDHIWYKGRQYISLRRFLEVKAEQKTKWIPVSENLPEENITVLGTTKFDDIYKTELYDDCGEKKWYANGNFDVPIVAWMPKPKTYEESEETE